MTAAKIDPLTLAGQGWHRATLPHLPPSPDNLPDGPGPQDGEAQHNPLGSLQWQGQWQPLLLHRNDGGGSPGDDGNANGGNVDNEDEKHHAHNDDREEVKGEDGEGI